MSYKKYVIYIIYGHMQCEDKGICNYEFMGVCSILKCLNEDIDIVRKSAILV